MVNVYYLFYLGTTWPLTGQTYKKVAPHYGGDLAISWEKESGQQFYRAKLSGNLKFVGADYDYIMSQPFDTRIYIQIRQSAVSPIENYRAWTELWSGSFMRTDCEIDEEDKIITVQPEALDRYTDVLAGLEKEYNIAGLPVSNLPVSVMKRPLIQVYKAGDSVISCFLSQMYWEQDVITSTTDDNALKNTYHFEEVSRIGEVQITAQGGASTAYNGLYLGNITKQGENEVGTFQKAGTNYSIVYARLVTGGVVAETYTFRSGSSNIYSYTGTGKMEDKEITFSPASGQAGSLKADMQVIPLYMRYLVDLDEVEGKVTSPLPADDIVENNRNYKRVVAYDIDTIVVSTNFSDEPTEWGMSDDGRYFLPPGNGAGYYPVARSTWKYMSLWFRFYDFDWILEEDGRAPFMLNDTYPISSVISTLLAQFAPGVTHKATTDYSQFLYAETNPVSGQSFTLSISPKSNVTAGEYQDPASKANITLQDVLTMLANVYKCYWFIDENNRFRIEQIEWFRNGGKYQGSAEVGYDLTAMKNTRNGKSWDYATKKYSFGKIEMPERYQFSWMDSVTEIFEGRAIEMISGYVDKGNVEEVQVSKFTSDIDYMLLNPGQISDEGFALLASVEMNALRVPDSPGFGSSVTSGGYSPKKTINPAAAGRSVTINVRINTSESAVWQPVAYVGGVANNVGSQVNASGDVTQSTTFTLPANTTEIAVRSVSGSFTVDFYALYVPGVYELPFTQFTDAQGIQYRLQNGLLAFVNLQPTYWRFDMPARSLKINGQTYSAFSVQRHKEQEVVVPCRETIPDPMKVVKTSVGNGQIESFSLNLSSRVAEAKLVYDTE